MIHCQSASLSHKEWLTSKKMVSRPLSDQLSFHTFLMTSKCTSGTIMSFYLDMNQNLFSFELPIHFFERILLVKPGRRWQKKKFPKNCEEKTKTRSSSQIARLLQNKCRSEHSVNFFLNLLPFIAAMQEFFLMKNESICVGKSMRFKKLFSHGVFSYLSGCKKTSMKNGWTSQTCFFGFWRMENYAMTMLTQVHLNPCCRQ